MSYLSYSLREKTRTRIGANVTPLYSTESLPWIVKMEGKYTPRELQVMNKSQKLVAILHTGTKKDAEQYVVIHRDGIYDITIKEKCINVEAHKFVHFSIASACLNGVTNNVWMSAGKKLYEYDPVRWEVTEILATEFPVTHIFHIKENRQIVCVSVNGQIVIIDAETRTIVNKERISCVSVTGCDVVSDNLGGVWVAIVDMGKVIYVLNIKSDGEVVRTIPQLPVETLSTFTSVCIMSFYSIVALTTQRGELAFVSMYGLWDVVFYPICDDVDISTSEWVPVQSKLVTEDLRDDGHSFYPTTIGSGSILRTSCDGVACAIISNAHGLIFSIEGINELNIISTMEPGVSVAWTCAGSAILVSNKRQELFYINTPRTTVKRLEDPVINLGEQIMTAMNEFPVNSDAEISLVASLKVAIFTILNTMSLSKSNQMSADVLGNIRLIKREIAAWFPTGISRFLSKQNGSKRTLVMQSLHKMIFYISVIERKSSKTRKGQSSSAADNENGYIKCKLEDVQYLLQENMTLVKDVHRSKRASTVASSHKTPIRVKDKQPPETTDRLRIIDLQTLQTQPNTIINSPAARGPDAVSYPAQYIKKILDFLRISLELPADVQMNSASLDDYVLALCSKIRPELKAAE